MIVVSDTSPITALLTVGEERILAELFGKVIIPDAVHQELLKSHAFVPSWIEVQQVSNTAEVIRLSLLIDLGEAQAIELAKELDAELLLIDERKGRRLAEQEGVPIIGLLGVVLLAKRKNIIPSARNLLRGLDVSAGVYLAKELVEKALKAVDE
jgi:predicted nucleic acid-binding protein